MTVLCSGGGAGIRICKLNRCIMVLEVEGSSTVPKNMAGLGHLNNVVCSSLRTDLNAGDDENQVLQDREDQSHGSYPTAVETGTFEVEWGSWIHESELTQDHEGGNIEVRNLLPASDTVAAAPSQVVDIPWDAAAILSDEWEIPECIEDSVMGEQEFHFYTGEQSL